jgi:hypothetical protein
MTLIPFCKTCRHYQGTMGYGTICGMHAFGPETTPCPDHEVGPRYSRPLEIRHEPDPTTVPAVVEAERLSASARARLGWWGWRRWGAWRLRLR